MSDWSSILFPCTIFNWFLYQSQTCLIFLKKGGGRKFCFPFCILEQVSAHFFYNELIVNGSRYFRQCGPYGLHVEYDYSSHTSVSSGNLCQDPHRDPNQRMLKSMDQLYPSLYPCILHPWIQVAVCTQLCHKAAINNKETSGSDYVPIKF